MLRPLSTADFTVFTSTGFLQSTSLPAGKKLGGKTMRRCAFAVLLAIKTICFSSSAYGFEDVDTEIRRLRVAADGSSYQLEVLIAAPHGRGRYPVAIMTHGSAGGPTSPEDIRAETELGSWALDFAHRGYMSVAVIRRGYGMSDGMVFDDAGSCADPKPDQYLQAHADDIEAVLRAISDRPDVDMSRIVAVGHSTGGAIMLALSARKTFPLAAVISVSGGLYHYEQAYGPVPFHAFDGCENFAAKFVETVGSYAQGSSVPTLWLYAENDPWFGPSLVETMRNSWLGHGGLVSVKIFPPFLLNGHRLFFEKAGRRVLLPAIDDFLRDSRLPSWEPHVFDKLKQSLSDEQKKALDEYLAGGGAEKAVAITGDHSGPLYWVSAMPTLFKAIRQALLLCKQGEMKDCRILAANFEPAAP